MKWGKQGFVTAVVAAVMAWVCMAPAEAQQNQPQGRPAVAPAPRPVSVAPVVVPPAVRAPARPQALPPPNTQQAVKPAAPVATAHPHIVSYNGERYRYVPASRPIVKDGKTYQLWTTPSGKKLLHAAPR